MAIGLNNILSLIGGTPQQIVGTVLAEKLKIVKSMQVENIAGLLNSVLSGDIGSILQDPTALANGLLGSAVSSVAGNLTAALGGSVSGLVSVMTGAGGLSSALGDLSTMTSALSGLTAPASGGFGLLDIVSHSNLVGMFGDAVPSIIGMAAATAPLMSSGVLESMANSINAMGPAVIGGSQSIPDATAQVSAYTAQINAMMAASTGAMATMQTALPQLATISAVAAATASSSDDMQTVLPLVVQPAALVTMQAAAFSQYQQG